MQFRVPIKPLLSSHQCVNRGYHVYGDADGTIFLFSGILSPSKVEAMKHLELTNLRLIDALNHNLSPLLMISMRPLVHPPVLSGLRISIHSQVSVGPPRSPQGSS